jgi:hypothetical protein
MFSPFVRKKLRDISQKPSTIQRTFFRRFLSIGEEKMPPLSKKRGHHDLRILRFERIASTAAVRTHRKNERFSLAPELLILLLGKPQALNFRIENTS